MAKITLVTGGARSGKSDYALSCALQYAKPRTFVATAVAFDEEMVARIAKHREERSNEFITLEEPYELANAIVKNTESTILLIDCLTVWLGNLFFRFEKDPGQIQEHIDQFLKSLNNISTDVILVTNELGSGIVPDNALSRMFRDCAGRLNRQTASIADTVVLTVCGIPIKVKGS